MCGRQNAYVAVLRLPDLIALFAFACAECGKTGSHSHSNGQRRFKVENGYVQLSGEQEPLVSEIV